MPHHLALKLNMGHEVLRDCSGDTCRCSSGSCFGCASTPTTPPPSRPTTPLPPPAPTAFCEFMRVLDSTRPAWLWPALHAITHIPRYVCLHSHRGMCMYAVTHFTHIHTNQTLRRDHPRFVCVWCVCVCVCVGRVWMTSGAQA
jgi:hypothetical protein